MNKLNKPSILVIDPDALSLTAISAVLHGKDFEVHIAQDEEAALKGATSLELDLIICDENIDDEQGAKVIGKIRELPNCIDTPIMYMSTNQGPDIIHRAQGNEAAYHLRKPIDSSVLMELVDTALWQLPIINEQVRVNSVKKPHFKTTAVPSSVNIPSTSTLNHLTLG